VVVANDVPHDLCETFTPARFLAARGYRVLVFDYRDRGTSDTSNNPGRLDKDGAGAVAELRSRGAVRVILLGSYAGVAASVVAATEIQPPVDGLIGISPAAFRGQWVQGPFGPIGALQAAPHLRVPALYVTVRTDSYVSLGEVRRLFRLTGSPNKDLLVIPSGSAGFDMIDFNSYGDRVRTAILSFVGRFESRPT
jgi:pimeloyl-ACP methyl ester carboxylesterase